MEIIWSENCPENVQNYNTVVLHIGELFIAKTFFNDFFINILQIYIDIYNISKFYDIVK